MNSPVLPRFITQAEPVAQKHPAPVQTPVATPSQAKDDIDILQLLGVIWRGKWLITAFAALMAFVGAFYAYVIAPPEFTATARLTMQVHDQHVNLENVIAGISTEQSAINTELEVIGSRKLVSRLVNDLNLIDDPEFNAAIRPVSPISLDRLQDTITQRLFRNTESDQPTQIAIQSATIQAVLSAINVTAQRNTYLMGIHVTTRDPAKSAEMANRLAQIYLDDQIALKFDATEYAVDWLSSRVKDLELDLNAKEDAIKTLRAETELVSLNALEALNVRAKGVRDRLSLAQAALSSSLVRIEQSKSIGDADNAIQLAGLYNDSKLSRLATIVTTSDDKTSAITAFQGRLSELSIIEQDKSARMTAQRDDLQTSLDEIQGQIDLQNADLVKLTKMEREADATRVLYETFLTRLKEASVRIGLQRADSRIMSNAVAGEQVRPRKQMIIAIALLFGGSIGLALVLARQFLQRGFRTTQDLEQATNHAVLGQIPQIPIRKRAGLIPFLRAKPTSAVAEAIRNLRTSVLLSNIDNPPRVIMSTSSVPGEGKSTQAIALAHNLSGLGKRVLLVEGDIRRRTFSQYFSKSSANGLVSVVSGECTLEAAIFHDPDIEADVLMGDHSSINAGDLFSSQSFRDFMQDARAAYDFVIIDTPPVLVVPDARIIARLVDTIIYSVKWDSTSEAQVSEGLRQFSSVGVKVSGLILSQINARRMRRYGYGRKSGAYANNWHGYYDVT